jgi:hypothetical protein
MNAAQIFIRRWWLDAATPGDFLRITLHLVGGDTPPRLIAAQRNPYFAHTEEVF